MTLYTGSALVHWNLFNVQIGTLDFFIVNATSRKAIVVADNEKALPESCVISFQASPSSGGGSL